MAKIERTYNVPLRKGFIKSPRYKKAKKAVITLREFLARHMKTDIENIKIGRILNEKIWEKGIRKPPHHVKITAVKDDEDIVKAELFGFRYEEVKEEEKKETKDVEKEVKESLGATEKEEKKQEPKEKKKPEEKPVEKKETTKKTKLKAKKTQKKPAAKKASKSPKKTTKAKKSVSKPKKTTKKSTKKK